MSVIKFPTDARLLQVKIDKLPWKIWHLNRHSKNILKVLATRPGEWFDVYYVIEQTGESAWDYGGTRLYVLNLIEDLLYQDWIDMGRVIPDEEIDPRYLPPTPTAELIGVHKIRIIPDQLKRILK